MAGIGSRPICRERPSRASDGVCVWVGAVCVGAGAGTPAFAFPVGPSASTLASFVRLSTSPRCWRWSLATPCAGGLARPVHVNGGVGVAGGTTAPAPATSTTALTCAGGRAGKGRRTRRSSVAAASRLLARRVPCRSRSPNAAWQIGGVAEDDSLCRWCVVVCACRTRWRVWRNGGR